MSESNVAAVIEKPGVISVKERQIGKPGKNEVLVRMKSVGICGTDIHIFKDGYSGDFKLTQPVVTGHEASGVIVEVGEGVTHLKPGDRVVLEPGTPCRMCEFCKIGKYSLCPDLEACSLPPKDGLMQKYVIHTADFAFKIPDKISFDEGAVVEPLAVAVHACRRAGVTAGDKVLITGAGPIGFVIMLVAKAMGVASVLVTDVREGRLEFIAKHGADHTLLVSKDDDEQKLVKAVHEKLGGAPNVSMECSGYEQGVRLAVKATKPGGVVTLVGLASLNNSVPTVEAAIRELDIRGVFRFTSPCFPIAISLLESGRVDVRPLISHHFDLKDAPAAFEQASSVTGGSMKVMVHC